MLYYDITDINEGTDPAKSNNSKECMVSHYWFFNYGFEFQDYIYNGCHDLTMLCLNISNIVIIIFKGVDYWYIFYGIMEAINL